MSAVQNQYQDQYSIGLDKTPANYVPLTPLSFLSPQCRRVSGSYLHGL